MTGIIDIGSNTIRLVIYDDKGRQMSNTGINSEIINDTKKGILTQNGIEKLCNQLVFLKDKAEKIPVSAFATYAVRILKNREYVKKQILDKTGINIDILSGEREAYYDFLGLMSTLSDDADGVGMDLGGGSGQIMIFKKGKLNFSSSYPIGCRRVKNKFFKDKFPDKREEDNLKKYIFDTLSNIRKQEVSSDILYMMGGTAKTAAKIYTYLKSTENINVIKRKEIGDLIRFIRETPEDVMKNILKNRYDNIVAGIMIMDQVAEMIGAEELHIKKCGVRDGYWSKNKAALK